MRRRGKLIALEGAKLAGKTTLALAFKSAFPEVVLCKLPSPSYSLRLESELSGQALLDAIHEDRRNYLVSTLEPALSEGHVVLIDRYKLSAQVFHGIDGVDKSVISALNSELPDADVTAVAFCSIDELKRRRAKAALSRLQGMVSARDELEKYVTLAHLSGLPSTIEFLYNETPECEAANIERLARVLSVIKESR